jgi:hypothetical protein
MHAAFPMNDEKDGTEDRPTALLRQDGFIERLRRSRFLARIRSQTLEHRKTVR